MRKFDNSDNKYIEHGNMVYSRLYGKEAKNHWYDIPVRILFGLLSVIYYIPYVAVLLVVPLYLLIYNRYLAYAMIAVIVIGFSIRPLVIVCKRAAFSRRLSRICREKGHILSRRHSFARTLFFRSGDCDFTVETADALYAVAFIPTFGRTVKLEFSKEPDYYITVRPPHGIRRINEAFGFGPRVRRKKFNPAFPPAPEGKELIRAVLLSPVPRAYSCYDAHDDRFVEFNAAGADWCGRTIYNTTGFLRELM